MDYDKLVEQRRRNWEALKPDEIRKQEKDEQREKAKQEREAKGKKASFQERRRKAREEQQKKDVALFQRNKRQIMILAGGFVLVFLFVVGAERLLDMRQRRLWKEKIEFYNLTLREGELIDNLKDPVGALATWRSALRKGNMQKLVDLYSPMYLKKASGSGSKAELVNEHQRMYARGSMQSNVEVATFFDMPDLLHIPSKPWRDKDLALFRTQYIQLIGEPPPGVRYIAAFSWDAKSGEWRFADVREAQFFNVRWDTEEQISRLQYGPNATRYNEEGERVLRE
jgi:hypothetical protein